MTKLKIAFVLALLAAFSLKSAGQEIIGEEYPNTAQASYTYTYTPEFLLLAPVWQVTGGTVLSQTVANGTYTATIKFNTIGSTYVTLKRNNSTIVFATLEVIVTNPPATPTPTISYLCGSTTVTSPVTSGVTFYWQISSSGKSISDASASKTVTASGTTLYLRGKLNGSTDNWGSAAVITPTVQTSPSGGTIVSPSPFYNIASGQLSLTGASGTVEKWQSRLVGESWSDIAGSSGATAINFSGLEFNTEFRALVGNGAACTGVSSSVATVTVIQQDPSREIVGEAQPNILEPSYTYTYTADFSLLNPVWIVSGGTVVSQSNLGNTYTATIHFTTIGAGSITFRRNNSTIVYGTKVITIVNPPATPTPTINYACGSTTVTSPVTSGVTYYWQASSSGKSTSDASASKTVTVSGTTLYLRAKLNGNTDNWSEAAVITPTVQVTPLSGTITPPPLYYDIANGQLNLTGNTGTVERWQSRLPGGTWSNIAGTTGAASISFSEIEMNTEFRALVGNGQQCTGISSAAVTVVVATEDPENPILGEVQPNTAEPSYTYTFTNGFLLLAPEWVVTGGTILSQSNAGITYTVNIHFTTLGPNHITLKQTNSATIFATKAVTVVSPPATPVPAINYFCGYTTVTAPVTSGITYYWQTSSTGNNNSIGDASAAKTVTTPGTTLYLRAKVNGTNNWSAVAIITPTVYLNPVDGTIASPSPYYNTAAGQLTLTQSTGTIEKWQRRPAGGTWSDIANSAGATVMSFSNIDENTEFRALLGNGPCTSISSSVATVTVIQQNFEGKVTGTTKLIGTTNSGSLQLVNYTGTINEWQVSDDALIWQTISSSATPTLNITNIINDKYYRVKITKKSTTSYSPAFLVSWYPAITTNIVPGDYMLAESIRIKEPNATNIPNLTAAQKVSAYTYTDGLGRAVQTVTKSASTGQKDVIGFAVYDALGRQSRSYLPYTNTGSNYYTNYLSEQVSFYNGTSKVANDAYPFADVVFDGSPFSRVVEQGAPGSSWQVDPTHNTVRSLSRSNTANEVRIWKADGSSPGFYAANTLSVTEITDENSNKVISFTDNRGLLIQKHVQSEATTWLKTINIYDAVGRLIYTLQPEGVKQLGTSATISASLLSQFAFNYTYDTKGRQAETKVPDAAAPTYIIYDPLQRPLLVQDGNLRTANKWAFIKYDLQNRPVMSGLYTHNASITQAQMQALADGLYTTSNTAYPATAYYEDRATTLHGYTNVSFPKVNADGTPIEVLKVNFYDGYDFDDADAAADFSYSNQNLPGESGQAQGPSLGFATGAKQLVLGTSTWLYTYVFYDKYSRVIQSVSNNHLSSSVDNVVTNVYDFEGKVLTSKTFHNAGAGKQTTVINKYGYDQAGRLINVYQNNNAATTDQLLAKYEYNELGQLVDKKLHNTGGTDFLQSVDYRYNIRGWLNSINNAQLEVNAANNDETTDYFGMEFLYNTVDNGLGNTGYFNGNISATKWKGIGTVSGLTNQSSYKYSYDKADRLLTATSQMYTGTAWSKEANAYNETLAYDDNGNIKTLLRNQRTYSAPGSYVTQTIDNLAYTYANGNVLSKVEDAVAFVTTQTGFNNTANTTTEYSYNTNGSLTADQNKGISSIVYNVLNKPQQILFTDGHKIEYTYDASGNKLTVKTFTTNGTPQTTTDYVGSFVYENSTLSFFSSPEGRVVNKAGALEYQYSISDNQGNTRIVFSSLTPTPDEPTATFEGNTNDKSAEYRNVANIVPFAMANHSGDGSKVVRMNQTYKIGPAKSISVFPGDKVDIEVWEYHEGASGFGTTSSPASTLVTMVAGAFGGVAGGAGESGLIYAGVDNAANFFGTGGNAGDSRPAAYLNYILFDKNYNVLDAGFQLAPATTFTQQRISFNTLNIKEAGYVYTYLSYEDESNNWVYFDDFKVTHTKTNVVQYNEYYPFGLQTNKSWTRDNTKNNFLYDGAMELNPTTGWYDLAFRNYDPALGRFVQVDPMTEKYAGLSSYNYAFNNPLSHNDPNGADPPYGYDRFNAWLEKQMIQMDGGGGGGFGGGGIGGGGDGGIGGDSGNGTHYGGGGWRDGKGIGFNADLLYAGDRAHAYYQAMNGYSVDPQTFGGIGYNENGEWGIWQQFTDTDNSTFDAASGTLSASVVGMRFLSYLQIQGNGSHDEELAKYGTVISGVSSMVGGGVLKKGLVVEYGIVDTDKNWHQKYKTVYKVKTTASISLTGNFFVVTNRKGFNTTFSDWAGPVDELVVGRGLWSISYGWSTTYTTIGGGVGPGLSLPTSGTGAYMVGITTLIGEPWYYVPTYPEDKPFPPR